MKEDNYTYLDAGFNRFFRRSIASNPEAMTLRNSAMGGGSGNRELAFDRLAVSGQLGDILKIGNVYMDGRKGQITVSDGERVRVLIGFDPEGF